MTEKIGSLDIMGQAAGHIPDASGELIKEAFSHPVDTALHVGTTVATSALMGAALGYIVPARGPLGMIVGAAFTIPMVVKGVMRVEEAKDAANAQGADVNKVSKDLAKSAVTGTVDLGLNLVGGYYGAEFGHNLALGDHAMGNFAQSTQRLGLKGENEALISLGSLATRARGFMSRSEVADVTSLSTDAVKAKSLGILNTRLETEAPVATPTDTVVAKPTTALGRRLQQYGIANHTVERTLTGGPADEMQMYFGSLHGHSRYSDGMGLPKDLYAKAQAEGQQVTTITDHNHLAARGGVSPTDPRAGDQSGTPTVAENPIEYSQTFADAAATTNKDHLSLVGTEMGTIGKVGGGHTHGMPNPESVGELPPDGNTFDLADARLDSNAAAHIGGVNHINLLEVPTFFEAVRQQPGTVQTLIARFTGKDPSIVSVPDVVKYNDGDYRSMVDHLDKLKDTTGNTPVIQLNHPRYLADENVNTPLDQRSRDYGQKSFNSQQEWLTRFADPYVRQIELIKGGALNPNPVDTVPTGNLDPTSFAGYIDKRVHASPTFGRDFHFGDPVGNPGATGIYAKGLDKLSILDALRERRTIATTSSKNLSGVLSANDKFVMGSILDQSAVDSLALKMRIDGNVDPNASYSVKLWGDTNIGDGKLAEVLQEKTMKGSDLLSSNQTVAFDPLKGKVGQSSAYYVEVGRTDPTTSNLDRMWTAPIWVEPLVGAKHSLATRWMAGAGSQLVLPNKS